MKGNVRDQDPFMRVTAAQPCCLNPQNNTACFGRWIKPIFIWSRMPKLKAFSYIFLKALFIDARGRNRTGTALSTEGF
jgi:hypothetical protein